MSDTYACVRCKKKRRGRFTRPRGTTEGTLGHTIPNWHCYICLPQGQGRDEDNTMKTATVTQPTVAVNLEREHQKGLALVNPIASRLTNFEVVDEESYLAADDLLGQIRRSRSQWKSIWEMIQDKVVRPQREALDGVYAVNREVDGPLEKGETLVKARMKDYKNEERRRLQAEEDERVREAERVQAEIDETVRKASMASQAPGIQKAWARRLNKLEAEQQTVIETVSQPVQGSSSSSRVVKVAVVAHLQQFLTALLVGSLRHEMELKGKVYASVNALIRAEGKTQIRKDEMATWPGIVIQDETQIVGR